MPSLCCSLCRALASRGRRPLSVPQRLPAVLHDEGDQGVDARRANALHEGKVRLEELYVKEAVVGAGPTLKRWLPRAQGRATPILKRMSHVSVTVATKESL